MLRHVWRQGRALTRFDGKSQDALVEEFRRSDQERIALARGEVAAAHYDAMPRDADRGEMAVLRNEIRRSGGTSRSGKLLKEAGTAVQAIKPVFMMSPISVAQYLEPGSVEFDLLLIDEASQVRPVDALGAMARAEADGRRRGRQAAPADAVLQQDARRRRASTDDDDEASTPATSRASSGSASPRGCRSGCSAGTTGAGTIR